MSLLTGYNIDVMIFREKITTFAENINCMEKTKKHEYKQANIDRLITKSKERVIKSLPKGIY